MAFTLLQVGDELKTMNLSGELSTPLTLPTGVTLATNTVPRFARFSKFAIVVNTPSKPIVVSSSGEVFPLGLTAPTTAMTMTAGAAGGLTGAYRGLYTFRLYDSDFNIVSESGYSPDMPNALTVSAQRITEGFEVSTEQANARVLYRTTANGAVYFPSHIVNNNTDVSYSDNNADDSLGILEAPELGTVPVDLRLIVAWQGRLWGVTKSRRDQVRYSESGRMYAWPELNSFFAGRVGNDEAGVTGFVPRRNILGLGKKTEFSAVSGTSRSNFVQVTLSDQVGVDSQESVAIYRDVAYFLWRDGVYTWSDEGFKCISDLGNVRTWFATDSVLSRGHFYKAFGSIDATTMRYRLFLVSAANTATGIIDTWVEYDIRTGKWFGPHATTAFTPTCAFEAFGANQLFFDMVGSDEGFVSIDQEDRNDWGDAIAMSAKTKPFSPDPDRTHMFGELSVLTQKASAGTLLITPTVGELGSNPKDPYSHYLKRERIRHGALGYGRVAALTFTNNEVDVNPVIYGIVIDGVNTSGRR